MTLSEPFNRTVSGAFATQLTERLAHCPSVELDDFHYHDVVCLATGVFHPLTGFLNRQAYRSVLDDWSLPDGSLWPIPITLPVQATESSQLKRTRLAALRFQGEIVAAIHVEDLFWVEPEDEVERIFGTRDPRHPGVARTLGESPIRVAGMVTLLQEPAFPVAPVYTPQELIRIFRERNWRTVVAFQTRNPLHRAHEYVQKAALEHVDGLLLHPLIGTTKADDVQVKTRWKIYEVLLDTYFPEDRTLLSGFPAAMRYAGPREAMLHAIARRNHGCTHFIVGRDHAGFGSYYHPLAAQQLLTSIPYERLGIQIVTPAPAFYCYRCGQMATERTCPHPAADHEVLSGTRVRKTLAAGENLPAEAIRPEVARILRDYYRKVPPPA